MLGPVADCPVADSLYGEREQHDEELLLDFDHGQVRLGGLVVQRGKELE